VVCREQWNVRYRECRERPVPARVLVENRHLLPREGLGLDLACGLGGNALLLAEHGLETQAWDISDVAVHQVNAVSRQRLLPLIAEVRDVIRFPPLKDYFDCVVVSRFLCRELATPIIESLRPGGILFYQTFTREKQGGVGPSNPEWLLGTNELLFLFSALRILVYREEGTVGDGWVGWRDEALLVGMKVN